MERFYEFYHSADDAVALSKGLQRIGSNRRGVRFGFPVFQLSYLRHNIMKRGLSILFVRETEKVCGKIRERLPDYRLIKVVPTGCIQ